MATVQHAPGTDAHEVAIDLPLAVAEPVGEALPASSNPVMLKRKAQAIPTRKNHTPYGRLDRPRVPKHLKVASWTNRKADFLLGTSCGCTILMTFMSFVIVMVGALSWWASGGSDAIDLGLEDDSFWDSIWASYIMFIDIGSQAGLHTSDHQLTLLTGVAVSLGGFVFVLIVLGVVCDVISRNMEHCTNMHKRVVANGHTLVLGWSDKSIDLVHGLANMMRHTRRGATPSGAREDRIVILCECEPLDIVKELRNSFGPEHHGAKAAYQYNGWLQTHSLHKVPIVFFQGNRCNPYDLERVSLFSAKSVLAIADMTKDPSEADQEVVRTILASNAVRESLQCKLSGQFITEVRNHDNQHVVETIGGINTECIMPRDTINSLLALSCLAPNVASAFRSLLSFNEGCEIYEVDTARHPWSNLEGLTVREFMTIVNDAIVIGVTRGGRSYHPHMSGLRIQSGDILQLVAHSLVNLSDEVTRLQLNLASKVEEHRNRAHINNKAHHLRVFRSSAASDHGPGGASLVADAADKMKKRLQSSINFRQDISTRKVIIMGWDSDLFELMQAFAQVAANIWATDDAHMKTEVHILGGPTDGRKGFWQENAGNVSQDDDTKLRVVVSALGVTDEATGAHTITIFHHTGKPSQLSCLQQLPLMEADTVLILSGDDESGDVTDLRESDAQCLTNLLLLAQASRSGATKRKEDGIESKKGGASKAADASDETWTPMNVICEVLDPNTLRTVKAPHMRNPFRFKSPGRRAAAAVWSDTHLAATVTYFATNQLETALLALSCYDHLLTLYQHNMITALGLPIDAAKDVPLVKVAPLEAIAPPGSFTDASTCEYTFRELEHLLFSIGRYTLLGWQRHEADGSVRNELKYHNPIGLNPKSKNKARALLPNDIIVFV